MQAADTITAATEIKLVRTYKARRRQAPALIEILRGRIAGKTISEIAGRYGCERRTVYSALGRMASRGYLAPLLIPALFKHGTRPSNRLWKLVARANKAGVQVRGWKEAQKVPVADLKTATGAVKAAVERELAP